MSEVDSTTEPVVGWNQDSKVNGSSGVDAAVEKEPTSPVKLPSNKAISEDGDGDDVSEADGPPEVQRRVKALKKIQIDVAHTESSFFREMHDLEMKFANKYTDFYEKRREIITGKYEPTDVECEFNCGAEGKEPAGAEAKEETADAKNESVNKLKLDKKKSEGEALVSGIPDFWLTIFQNVEMLEEMIQPHDLPIIQHLTDIKVKMTSTPMGFELWFYFAPNDYFTNPLLYKKYEMKCEVDPEDPFSFEGPEIIKCSGCKIDWHEGKNVTVKIVRKKQKHKQTGSVRMVNKEMEIPSFFEFFSPPQVEEGEELDEEEQLKITNHFEVGQYIRERIVPRAVLYYTGEALEDDEDDEEDYDEEDDEEGEDDSEGAIEENADGDQNDNV